MAAANIPWPAFKLNNNLELPALGLSTSQLTEHTFQAAVDNALSIGYRCFDTASNNDYNYLANALTFLLPKHHLERDDIYIIRTLRSHEVYSARSISFAYKNMSRCFENEYIDLLLMAYPGKSNATLLTPKHKVLCNNAWGAVTELYDDGSVTSIGVANFSAEQLQDLINENPGGTPSVCQLTEWHPDNMEHDLMKVCRGNNLTMQVLSPRGDASDTLSPLKNKTLLKIAADVSATPSQILLFWSLQNDVAALVQSEEPQKIAANFELEFRLSPGQMNALNKGSLTKTKKASHGSRSKSSYLYDFKNN